MGNETTKLCFQLKNVMILEYPIPRGITASPYSSILAPNFLELTPLASSFDIKLPFGTKTTL